VVGLALLCSIAVAPQRAQAASYVVNDAASFNAFLTAIGGTGTWSDGFAAYVSSGTLPAGSTLTFTSATTPFRPQQPGGFTNNGTVIINSTGYGFYNAGDFVNNGTLHIVNANPPQNYSTLENSGQFITDVPFYNGNTFINHCGGTVTGTITGNAVTSDCAGASYVVSDAASFYAFLTAIGGTGTWNDGFAAYVSSGTLPAGSTLTFISATTPFRPQQPGGFTNNGTVIINSTGYGFYNAGDFVNNGILHITNSNPPQNYSTLENSGQFITDVTFYNGNTIINHCGGTVTGTITGNPVTSDCPVPTQERTWGRVKAQYR
jgi:hypothetical protein